MPGLVPGIHVLLWRCKKDVDGRDKPGHDEKMNQFRGSPKSWLLFRSWPQAAMTSAFSLRHEAKPCSAL